MDFRPYLITVPANGRAQMEVKVTRRTSQVVFHNLEPPLQDPGGHPLPSCVEDTY
jgi:hypothetical protein